MKGMRRIIVIGLAIVVLSATSLTAFAASQYKTAAEAVAGLTGRDIESVITERVETGNTYGTIANIAGVLEEFKVEMLEMKKDALNIQVQNGTLTQVESDAYLAAIEEHQAICDGTGTNCTLGGGCVFGDGLGMGNGQGQGFRQNGGCGRGMGNGLRNGSCHSR